MKLLFTILMAAFTLLVAVVVGTLCGVSRIPGVVEPGYLHPDDKE